MTALSHQGSATVDAERWPDVAAVPHHPLRARVARSLFRRAVAGLPLRVELPDGQVLGHGGPTMTVRRPEALYARLGAAGLVGFGEAYMARDWEADDLTGVLTVFASAVTTLVPPWLQSFRRLAVLGQPAGERNTRRNSRHNVARHYDLSNELFELFLDETMTYSCALFAGPGREWDDLAAAQRRKIDRLLDGVAVGAGTELLEVGTGWGELALRAAGRGARVTSLTLSAEQKELAERRLAAAGLADRVTVELRDYRAQEGRFDAVVSVEMIEAVGYDYWPVYFAALDRALRPGGRVGLQAITMPHERMLASRNTYTWMHKYVFPGGIIPSTTSVEANVRRDTGLRVLDRFTMGPDYAATLRLWRARFESRAGEVEALGFDETFRRMWSFYLAYSEAGFRSGYLDVHQYVLAKESA